MEDCGSDHTGWHAACEDYGVSPDTKGVGNQLFRAPAVEEPGRNPIGCHGSRDTGHYFEQQAGHSGSCSYAALRNRVHGDSSALVLAFGLLGKDEIAAIKRSLYVWNRGSVQSVQEPVSENEARRVT